MGGVGDGGQRERPKQSKLLIEKLFVSICLWEEAEKKTKVFFWAVKFVHTLRPGVTFIRRHRKNNEALSPR